MVHEEVIHTFMITHCLGGSLEGKESAWNVWGERQSVMECNYGASWLLSHTHTRTHTQSEAQTLEKNKQIYICDYWLIITPWYHNTCLLLWKMRQTANLLPHKLIDLKRPVGTLSLRHKYTNKPNTKITTATQHPHTHTQSNRDCRDEGTDDGWRANMRTKGSGRAGEEMSWDGKNKKEEEMWTKWLQLHKSDHYSKCHFYNLVVFKWILCLHVAQ